MQIRFGADTTGRRWAWTDGLAASGQLDLAVPVAWPADAVRDREVAGVFEFVAQYVAGQPRRVRPGETLRYGWTTLRFDAGGATGPGAGKLVVSEVREPLRDAAPEYESGVATAIALTLAQDDALRRNHISGDADYPHRSEQAVICTRVPPAAKTIPHPLVLERRPPADSRHSGWIVRCTDPAHDHDSAGALTRTELVHIVAAFAPIFPYLAMPAGTAVLFDANTVVVFPAGSDEGRADPGDPLAWAF